MLKKLALLLALVCAPAAVVAQAFPGMTVCSPGTGTGVCVGQNSPTLTGTVTLPSSSTPFTLAANSNNLPLFTLGSWSMVNGQTIFGESHVETITFPS
ncbi:MAG TPA: hypothetical protein VMD53_06115, partial [Rhizomicrobium sp.]|nr:hypothetical protein [Rhizomicrobium sp.]